MGAFSMILIGFVDARIPLLTNCVIASMFQHPDPSLYFLKPPYEGANCSFHQDDLSIFAPISSSSGNYPINNQAAVAEAMKESTNREIYANLLELPESDPRLYDIASSTAAQ